MAMAEGTRECKRLEGLFNECEQDENEEVIQCNFSMKITVQDLIFYIEYSSVELLQISCTLII